VIEYAEQMGFFDSFTLFSECLLVAAVSGGAWYAVIVAVDPHRREKGSAKSLFVSSVLGFASIPLVFLLYDLSPDLTSDLPSARVQEIVYYVLIVGPVEEFAKFFVFFLIVTRRKPVREPLDAMLHAAAVALAFSLTENVKYGLSYGADLVAIRALVSTPGHLTLACVWGFAYAALIHANPRRKPRDFIVLFFSIAPAAVLHGATNSMLMIGSDWWLIVDGALFLAAASLVLWLRGQSPYREFRLADSSVALGRIDRGLASQGDNFALNLRAAVAHAALGELDAARTHINRCLGVRTGNRFARALSGAISVLQGETAAGEDALERSYPFLSPGQKRTLDRLARHLTRKRRTDNAYNEFQLSMWIKSSASRGSRGLRSPPASP
jgi:RsiW-degrading membrane proteinase PrsW (M82 family)